MAADTLSITLSALADPTRRAILARLADGAATVKELSAPFAISGPAISKHLRVLERAGLIARGREAQWRPCRLEAAPLQEVAEWAEGYRRFWEESYDRLDEYLKYLQREESRMTTAESGALSVTTPSDTEIVVTRAFEAPRDLVWQAYTEPEHMRQWMRGSEGWVMPVCEMELRPGGAYRFGWRQEDGTEMVISGEVREVDAPARLVSTSRGAATGRRRSTRSTSSRRAASRP